MQLRGTFDRLFSQELAVAIAVFVLVVLLFAIALIRGRAGARGEPAKRTENHLLEGSYVLVLIVAAGFLAWLSITSNDHEQAAAGPPQVKVVVTGFQWCWRFSYPGQSVSVVGSCAQGSGRPTMVIPTHRSVEIEVTSADVIHEFWIPYFRYKVEALPDHVNHFRITLTHSGEWIGRCSEFCGLGHAFMDFNIKAVSPSAYKHWLLHHSASTALA